MSKVGLSLLKEKILAQLRSVVLINFESWYLPGRLRAAWIKTLIKKNKTKRKNKIGSKSAVLSDTCSIFFMEMEAVEMQRSIFLEKNICINRMCNEI